MTKKISLFLVVLAICLSASGQSLASEPYYSNIAEIVDLLNRTRPDHCLRYASLLRVTNTQKGTQWARERLLLPKGMS